MPSLEAAGAELPAGWPCLLALHLTAAFLRLQALESPLLVAVAAGSVALPTLLKLSDVLAAQKQDLSIGHQLPVEVELGKVKCCQHPGQLEGAQCVMLSFRRACHAVSSGAATVACALGLPMLHSCAPQHFSTKPTPAVMGHLL